MLRTLCIATLLTFSAAGLMAQDVKQLDGCTLSEDDYADIIFPVLNGTWTASNLGGKMSGMGMVIPLKPEPANPMTFIYEDSKLFVEAGEFGRVEVNAMPNTGWDEKDYPLLESEIDKKTMDVLPGCMVSDLQAVAFNGRQTRGADQVEMHTRLYVIHEDLLAGYTLIHLSGMQNGMRVEMLGRRNLTVTR
jgi:hypothetical protein